MSLNVTPLKRVRVVDRRVRLNNDREYGILKGGREESWQTFPAQSVANSSITITANPPSSETIVDRKVYVKVGYQLTFEGTSTGDGTLLNIGISDGLRAFPIAQTTQTATAKIGNDSVSTNLNQYFNATTHYHLNTDERQFEMSTSPSMLDQYQNYSDYLPYGSARNPLALFGENSAEQTRGGFPIIVETNSSTGAVVFAEVTEPMWISPYLWGHREESGLIGIQNLNFNFVFSDLSRIWSHATGNGASTITSLDVVIQSCEVLMHWISPSIIENIPKSISYPYYELDDFPTTVISPGPDGLPPGVGTTVTTNNIQLNSIPKRVYIFARRRNQDLSFLTSDTYAGIVGLNIFFANRQGLLSGATQQDLYQMSRRNGCEQSWASWTKYQGSVACVCFGMDIGLSPTESPGLVGNYQFSVKADIVNLNPPGGESINYDLHLLIVNEGYLIIILLIMIAHLLQLKL